MDSLQASRIIGGNATYKRASSDFYPTPPDVTFVLMKVLGLLEGTKIWESACGENHMVYVMKKMGYQVIGTDIQYGYDFLTAPMINCDWIITNPPFSQSEAFIEKCIEYKKPFCLLLKSQYWHARKRKPLFLKMPPKWILPLTWRPNFLFNTKKHASPLMDVMWVVWIPNYDYEYNTLYYPLDRPTSEEMKIFKEMK